jgi:hypothetical protein
VGTHLKSWVIEASKDGEEWVVLDRRKNCDDVKEANAVGTCSMSRSNRGRLIHLRQIGPAHSGQLFCGLTGFEIYGSLLSRHFEEEGLIARQKQECGKDVHDAGFVVCSASGKCDEWPAKNAADPGRENVFFSEDKPDQWICYDFGRKKVQPRGYLLRTGDDCGNPKESVVEGSQDGMTWTRICDGHNEKNSIINQKFSIVCHHFFGMLRLRQTGKNYLGQHQLGVEFLDVFGRVVYEESPSNSPRQPDWDCVPDLTPPLSTEQFGDLIGRCFPELAPAQVMELVWRFFPGLNAMQAVALTRKVIPMFTVGQAIELMQGIFCELDSPQAVVLIRELFLELDSMEVIRLVRDFFHQNDDQQVTGLIRRIECPAFRTVMKGVFRKEPVQEPAMRKVKADDQQGKKVEIDVPDGIIAHLTRKCGGNVHDRHVVKVTSGSFEKETCGANPYSGAYDNLLRYAAKNAVDLETDSPFLSAYRDEEGVIPHTRNNWLCYDFKERRIVPSHYTIRTNEYDPGAYHLKSWLVETSVDGSKWREVARSENNKQLNGKGFTATFPVADGGECRFIRLVNIGRNHFGNDYLLISTWEIFGVLIE